MKKLFILAVFLLGTALYSTHAQIRLGVRAGVNSSRFQADEFDVPVGDYILRNAKQSRTGFHFGLVSQVQISKFFMQPELLFYSNRNDLLIEDITNNELDLTEQTFNNLVVPVLIGMKFKPLKIGVGPVGSVLLRSKSQLLDKTQYKQTFKSATFGYQAGVGLDLGKLALDVKYEGNLSKFGNAIQIGDESFSFDQRPRQLIFSIGLFF